MTLSLETIERFFSTLPNAAVSVGGNRAHGPRCPRCSPKASDPRFRSQKIGFFIRKSDSAKIQRFRCSHCGKKFSEATHTWEKYQKRRDINKSLFLLMSSLVSMRRSAKLLEVNDKTIARRLPYFKNVALDFHEQFLQMLRREGRLAKTLQFDDMETIEHTKLKPVSMPLVIDGKARLIYAIDAASMPAKGPRAKLSVKKYGKRADDRPKAWRQVLAQAKTITASSGVTLTSDMHNRYPEFVSTIMPGVKHIRKKGRKACVAGQGELKKGGFDPLFAINHTAAMLRANINRLIRKTWCTTKKLDRLICHLWLYALHHNVSIEIKRRQQLAKKAVAAG